jgi:hypothetical protein
VELEDAETGERLLIDAGSASARKQYQVLTTEDFLELQSFFRSAGIDWLEVQTGRPYLQDLIRFFKNRCKERAGRSR